MKAGLKNKKIRLLLFLAIAAVCSAMILNYYRSIDPNKLITQIHSLGAQVLFILIPYPLMILTDTAGWFNSFVKRNLHKSFVKLFFLRIATESLQTSLPGGAAYAEFIRPYLMKKLLKLDYAESISANIITKINILIAQVLFFICGILILILNYEENLSIINFIPEGLCYLLPILFIAPVFLVSHLLYKKDLLLRSIGLMKKVKIKSLGKLLTKIHEPAIQINTALSNFYNGHKLRLLTTIVFFFCTWMSMAFESLIILKIMGINANIFQVIMLESLISIIRMVFFFLPGAAGPQDVSIIMLFRLVGLPDPLINSFLFIILRRLKEIFWIITGYILLIYSGVKPDEFSGMIRKHPGFSEGS